MFLKTAKAALKRIVRIALEEKQKQNLIDAFILEHGNILKNFTTDPESGMKFNWNILCHKQLLVDPQTKQQKELYIINVSPQISTSLAYDPLKREVYNKFDGKRIWPPRRIGFGVN